MTIISSGDPVPWELLYPFAGADQDAGFLIDQFPVARRLGTMPPHQLKVRLGGPGPVGDRIARRRPRRDAGTHRLAGSPEHRGHDHRRPAGPAAASAARETSGCSTSPATTHSPRAPRTPPGSCSARQPFEPVFLEQHAGRFATAAPLVFMNACRTDGQAPLYTTIDGWALSFLQGRGRRLHRLPVGSGRLLRQHLRAGVLPRSPERGHPWGGRPQGQGRHPDRSPGTPPGSPTPSTAIPPPP